MKPQTSLLNEIPYSEGNLERHEAGVEAAEVNYRQNVASGDA